MKNLRKALPGISICLLLAAPAWFLGKTVPIIGGPVFGIMFGMIAAFLFPGPLSRKIFALPLGDGIKYTSKKLLQYSIILLGFEMNLFNLIKVGGQSIMVIVFTLTAAFLTAYSTGKLIKLNGKMTFLIGVGTSICGGSAIAATAPVIQADDKDVAQAISTIFLFNVAAVFIFPPLGHLLGLNDTGFGMWAGTAVNDTSSVVAAATAWSSAVGNNTALTVATIVKLTRTLMIVPITLALAIHTARKSKIAGSTAAGGTFEFEKVFPWFVIGFVAAAVAGTFLGLPQQLTHAAVTVGKFMIVMAMAAIGLNTDFKKLLSNGFKPIFLGLCCWFVVAAVSLIVQFALRIW